MPHIDVLLVAFMAHILMIIYIAVILKVLVVETRGARSGNKMK